MSLRATLVFLVAMDAFGQAPQPARRRRKVRRARNLLFATSKVVLE